MTVIKDEIRILLERELVINKENSKTDLYIRVK